MTPEQKLRWDRELQEAEKSGWPGAKALAHAKGYRRGVAEAERNHSKRHRAIRLSHSHLRAVRPLWRLTAPLLGFVAWVGFVVGVNWIGMR